MIKNVTSYHFWFETPSLLVWTRVCAIGPRGRCNAKWPGCDGLPIRRHCRSQLWNYAGSARCACIGERFRLPLCSHTMCHIFGTFAIGWMVGWFACSWAVSSLCLRQARNQYQLYPSAATKEAAEAADWQKQSAQSHTHIYSGRMNAIGNLELGTQSQNNPSTLNYILIKILFVAALPNTIHLFPLSSRTQRSGKQSTEHRKLLEQQSAQKRVLFSFIWLFLFLCCSCCLSTFQRGWLPARAGLVESSAALPAPPSRHPPATRLRSKMYNFHYYFLFSPLAVCRRQWWWPHPVSFSVAEQKMYRIQI